MKIKRTRLSQRTSALARKLKHETALRKSVQKKLIKSDQHYRRLLEQSRNMQEHLRHLSRQILLTQEEERKEISRELHDEIAQTLSGINVHLSTLKAEAAQNTEGLKKKITRTQLLVEKSVNIVHRFARDLRPTLLDDLGLIPALHSYMKGFSKRTGILVHFRASPDVEKLNSTKRTVLYRVAQAALTNVAQHAHATRVQLTIQKNHRYIQMKIADNGKSFLVERVLFVKKYNRLGLLGMRERTEMVGGRFTIESVKGTGTTVGAQVPY